MKLSMKTGLMLLTASLLLIAGRADKTETPEQVLTKVKNKYDSHTSLTYQINYRQKFFDGNDTAQWNATCTLIRETTDSLFGGYIWFVTTDSVERYYDLTHLYLIDHPKQKITEYKAHQNQTGIITGNVAGNVVKVHFLNTGKLLSDVLNTANQSTLRSHGKYYTVTIRYPNDDDFTEMEKTIRIRKDLFVIDQLTYKVKYEGDYQYSEWNLSNLAFDKVKATDLDKSIQSANPSYTLAQYVPPSEKNGMSLQAGVAAPNFTGTHVQTGRTLSLNDYAGKVVVLDFSYMSCMPCVKAIPHLTKLQQAYQDKQVVVLGVNSKDLDEKSSKRLPDFITKQSINYPLVLTGPQTDSVYRVKVYPTVYIVNKRGTIVYAQTGFSPQLGDTLTTLIDKLVKED